MEIFFFVSSSNVIFYFVIIRSVKWNVLGGQHQKKTSEMSWNGKNSAGFGYT